MTISLALRFPWGFVTRMEAAAPEMFESGIVLAADSRFSAGAPLAPANDRGGKLWHLSDSAGAVFSSNCVELAERGLSVAKRRLAKHDELSFEVIAECARDGFRTAYGAVPHAEWRSNKYLTDCLVGVATPHGDECVIRVSSANEFTPLYSKSGGVVGDHQAVALFDQYMNELIPARWEPGLKLADPLPINRTDWWMCAVIVLDRIIEEGAVGTVGGKVQVATVSRNGWWQHESAGGKRPDLGPNAEWVTASLDELRTSSGRDTSRLRPSE